MASTRPTYGRTASRGGVSGARSLEGKLAIVTGASRGIGASIAENLASKGASVVIGYTSDNSKTQAEELAKVFEEEYQVPTLVVQADMGNPKGPEYLIKTVTNHFKHPKSGASQIDIIINNAGVSIDKRIEETTVEDFDYQYRVNVLGPLLLIKEAKPFLPKDRSGRIINVSSVSATGGFVGQSIYGGSKAALDAMTRTWARELAENATVNSINPGPVATDMWNGTSLEFRASLKPFIQMTPLSAVREGIDDPEFLNDVEIAGGRPAYPAEIGGIVGMLTSAESGWCTGQVVCANGGAVFN